MHGAHSALQRLKDDPLNDCMSDTGGLIASVCKVHHLYFFFHEMLSSDAGHVPMLADKTFCDMVHSIGMASLCADDKQIWHLTKIYWYTVEFGVVEEGNDIKAFGAGDLFISASCLCHW